MLTTNYNLHQTIFVDRNIYRLPLSQALRLLATCQICLNGKLLFTQVDFHAIYNHRFN